MEKLERYVQHHEWVKSVKDQHKQKLEHRIKKEGLENIPEEERVLTSFTGCENPSSEDEEVRKYIKQHPENPEKRKKLKSKLKRQVSSSNTDKGICKANDNIIIELDKEDSRNAYLTLPQPIFYTVVFSPSIISEQ